MTSPHESEACTRFDAAVTELLNDVVTSSPIDGTYLGRHDVDDRLPCPSLDGHRTLLHIHRSALGRLDAIPSADLDERRRLDRDVLRWHVDLMTFIMDDLGRPMTGGHPVEAFSTGLHPLLTRPFAPPAVRARSLVGRMNAARRYFVEARECYVRPVAAFVHDEVAGCLAADDLLDTIARVMTEELPATLADDVERAAARARCAVADFAAWLRQDALPRATNPAAIGPEGFAGLIARRRLGLSVDELRELGDQSFADLQRAVEAEAERFAPGEGTAGAVARLRRDRPESFVDVLAAYRDAIGEARSLVETSGFVSLPKDELLVVERTPPHFEPSTPSAAYVPPEPLAPPPYRGVYLVTAPRSPEHAAEHHRAAIANISFHEAYPGHHVQSVHAAGHPSPLRLLVQGLEFVEGWAHYCEACMLELARDPHPGLRMSQLLDARYRALRIKLDVGLHCGTIDEAEGRRMMEALQGSSPETAEAEVGWYCREPGYALSYLVGKLQVLRLRDDVRRRRGPSFSTGTFHDELLAQGSLPMWALRRALLADD